MAAAGSLDEVIEVHEAYLLSIQRQCFVAPDKLVGTHLYLLGSWQSMLNVFSLAGEYCEIYQSKECSMVSFAYSGL